VLDKYLDSPVNSVNVPLVCKDRGIQVRDEKTNERAEYSTTVSLSVTGKDGRKATVRGTLAANGAPRLVGWGSHEMEANLEGNILVTRNKDVPGVIGAIGSLLGSSGVNIARMQVGLDAKKSEAVALWAVDSAIGKDLLEKIRGAAEIQEAFFVSIS
jgi:D-3-phosphoglycerate dehydrogenase